MDIKELIKSNNFDINNTSQFLSVIKEQGIEDINDYIIFSDKEDQEVFEETYKVLKDENTIDYDKRKYTLIAQTIDGDYIFSGLGNMYVVDISLDKNIVEEYKQCTEIEFFEKYLNGEINSKILSTK